MFKLFNTVAAVMVTWIKVHAFYSFWHTVGGPKEPFFSLLKWNKVYVLLLVLERVTILELLRLTNGIIELAVTAITGFPSKSYILNTP